MTTLTFPHPHPSPERDGLSSLSGRGIEGEGNDDEIFVVTTYVIFNKLEASLKISSYRWYPAY